MTLDDTLHIGPLALVVERLVAVGLMFLFVASIDLIVRRSAPRTRHVSLLALLAGLIAARGGHVWTHRESFALDPMAVLQVWLGGWSWVAGAVAAALVLAVTLRGWRALSAGLGVLALLALIWWAVARDDARRPPVRLPDGLRLERVDGGEIALDALRGQPVILNLWASWCPPCRREMPMLVNAARSEKRATLLLVNQGEAAEQLRAFANRERLPTSAMALDTTGLLGEIVGSSALPTTILIDAQGVARRIVVGEISRVQLDIAIRQLTQPSR